MNSDDTQEAIYCEDDGEYRVYCDICDLLCIEQFLKNHLKSGTHLNNFYKNNDQLIQIMIYKYELLL